MRVADPTQQPRCCRFVSGGPPQGAFPNPHHPPAGTTQRAVHNPVASFVTSELLAPECAIRCGLRGVPGTAVPETTVHKKCEPRLPEHEVWLAEQGLIAPPAGDAMPPEQPHQRQFRGLVPAPANPRHHFRPLRLGENVCHFLLTADYADGRRFNCRKRAQRTHNRFTLSASVGEGIAIGARVK